LGVDYLTANKETEPGCSRLDQACKDSDDRFETILREQKAAREQEDNRIDRIVYDTSDLFETSPEHRDDACLTETDDTDTEDYKTPNPEDDDSDDYEEEPKRPQYDSDEEDDAQPANPDQTQLTFNVGQQEINILINNQQLDEAT
jgi:hypothetical protein